MAINQLRKYIWLLDALRRNKKLTFKELNELWLTYEISEGIELSIRTFHKWRIAIEDLFAINIENEGRGEYRYYISTSYGIDNNPFYSWLIETFSLGNLMMNSISLHERILLEYAPSLRLKYKAFWQDTRKVILLEPYCIKQFKQRWYLLGRNVQVDRLLIYALDRILEIEKEENMKFKMASCFSAKEHFTTAYGIITGDETPKETVVLRVTDWHAHYLRSLPLHHTQTEKDSSNGYCTFEYHICPTLDFQQEILSMGAFVEVLSPQWLREQIGNTVKLMYEKYNQ